MAATSGWPGLQMYVKNYVQGCGPCQQLKITFVPTELTEGALNT